MSIVASLGFRTDLMLLTLQGSTVDRRDGYRVIRSPSNPHHYWGNFLLLDEPPEPGSFAGWLDTYERELPDAAHRAIGIDGTEGRAGDEDEIRAAGLAVERATVLTATALREPARTPGAELRMLADDADWEQSVALMEYMNDGEEPASYKAFVTAAQADKRALQDSGVGGWFGAFVDGRLVSHLGVFGDGSGVARYQTVETHPDFRRRGLAGSLVHLAGRFALDQLGASTLVIVADPEYVAIRLYRTLGFDGTETQVQLLRQPEW